MSGNLELVESGNLVFLAVAILCLIVSWVCIGWTLVRLIATYQEESEWDIEFDDDIPAGWEVVDYDRQEDFRQKDEYYDGR